MFVWIVYYPVNCVLNWILIVSLFRCDMNFTKSFIIRFLWVFLIFILWLHFLGFINRLTIINVFLLFYSNILQYVFVIGIWLMNSHWYFLLYFSQIIFCWLRCCQRTFFVTTHQPLYHCTSLNVRNHVNECNQTFYFFHQIEC